MPDFEVKITTPLEMKGAQQLAEQLEIDIGKAKALGQATDELSGKLKSVQSAIKNAGDGAFESGEKIKLLGRGAHEAHGVIDALNQALPGLQGITRFLMTGFTAAIGAAVIAYEYFKSKIEAVTKAIDDLTLTGERSNYLAKSRDEANQNAVAFDTWQHEIARVINAQETLRQRTDDLIAQQKTLAETQSQVRKADADLAAAQIDLGEKLGALAPEQAIKLKLQLDESGFKAELGAKIAAIQTELNARTGEQRQAQGQQSWYEHRTEDAYTAMAEAAAAKTRNDANLQQAKDNLAKTQAIEDKNQEAIDELERHVSSGPGRLDIGARYELEVREALSQQNQRVMGGYRREIQQGQARQTPIDERAAETKQTFDDAKKAYEDAAKEAKDLGTELQKLTDDLAAQRAAAQTLEAAHNATAEAKAQASQIDATKNTAKNGSITTGQIDTDIQTIRSQVDAAKGVVAQGGGNLEGLNALLTEILQLIHDIHASSAQKVDLSKLGQDVQQLRRQVDNQAQRARYGQYPT